MRIIRVLGVMLTFFSVACHSSWAASPAGHLVIIGGALRSDNAEIGNRIVELAGGKGARIAIIPAAAAEPEKAAQAIVTYLKAYGADPFVVPISVRMKDRDPMAEAQNAATAESIRQAGGVFLWAAIK